MKIFQKILCTFLVVLMCLTAAPLNGFADVEWSEFNIWFASEVNAAEETHVHTEEKIPGVAATCEKAGYTAGKRCSVCKEILVPQYEIPAIGHSYSEWVVKTAPTCSVAGVKESTCAICLKNFKEVIDRLPHTEVEIPAVEATCTTQGSTAGVKCSVCNAIIKDVETIPYKNHTIETIPGSDPDCETNGITEGKKCTTCNKVLTTQEQIAALGHELVVDVSKSIPATCTSLGMEYLSCTRCLYVERRDVAPLEHSYSEWVTTKEASCSDCGEQERVCSVCKTTDTQMIPSLGGHEVSVIPGREPTCTEPGKTMGSYCERCQTIFDVSEEIPPIGHIAYDYEIERATLYNDGFYAWECYLCGESVERYTIPRIDAESITLSETEYDYDGGSKTPYVTVYDVEGNELEEYIDYELEYESGRRYPGVYEVTVIFCGNYEGSVTLTFRIKASLMIYDFYADGNYTTVDLAWDASDDAEVFKVYQYYDGTYKSIDIVTDSYYTVRGLQPSTSYGFAVQAGRVDDNGKFIWGNRDETWVRTTGYSMCDHVDRNSDKICDYCGEESLRFAGNYAGTQFKLYTDGTLVVSGTGTAYCRWKNYREYIKRVIVEEGITGLDAGCFAVCTKMESVSLPSTLKMIGDQAFYACEDLETIDIPASVKMLGESVFSGCISLDNLVIPEGIKELYYYFASGCISLESVTLPSTLEAIGDGAFAECISLKEIVLPANLKRINGSFANCISLEKITIPDGVTTIGGRTFAECIKLKEITIPDSVTNLGYLAFYGCARLESIKLSNNLTSIEEQTFGDCVNLKSIIIPDSVSAIGGMAFAECKSLETVYIPETVDYIGYGAFADCRKLKNINIPDALTLIDWSVFYGLQEITEVTISDNVTVIGDLAFANCTNLKSVTMYNSVETIISTAFAGCENITDVYFYGTEDEWNAIDIWEYNDELLNADIHFLSSNDGHTHNLKTITINPTCTEPGKQYNVCADCGMQFGSATVLAPAHTPGSWVVVAEPTYVTDGTMAIFCVACGAVLEVAAVPKLTKITVSDVNTGIAVEVDPNKYNGNIAVIVDQTFNIAAFNLINAQIKPMKTAMYDINMIVGGVVSQPNGKVTVRIPVPGGYNPGLCQVYYLNADNGTVENMAARYENGYLVFETDHFSYYAIVELADTINCSCRCHNTGMFGKIIWSILNFFNKFMKRNQICGCGVYHY